MKILIEETWGRLINGDCRTVLPTLASDSIDSMVTDPPAGIEFMGKDWDNALKFGETFAAHGFSDGGDRIPAPAQKLSERNPVCKKCRKHIRGGDGCRCEEPESDEPPEMILERRLQQRRGFIAFMETVMREGFRVLKPGAHAVVWALPRTSHWTATALENVGFEIRDCIYHVKPRSPEVTAFLESLSPEQWELLRRCEPTDEFLLHVFGSGFPKSLDISKALDKMAGAVREVVGSYRVGGNALTPTALKGGTYGVGVPNAPPGDLPITAPSTPEAKLWAGWGTALKPAVEVWWIARKPVREVNVATQVRKTGTGALNIDGCRIASANGDDIFAKNPHTTGGFGHGDAQVYGESDGAPAFDPSKGRWPSHILLSHSAGCRWVGSKVVPAPVINRFDDGMKPFGGGAGHPYTATPAGDEEVSVFECAPECPVRMMDDQSGVTTSAMGQPHLQEEDNAVVPFNGRAWSIPGQNQHGDTGGASRFFQTFEHEPPFIYVAKASRAERDEGIKGETRTRRAVQYGGKKQRECNVCGSRSGPHKEGQSWPTCGHEDWRWVEQLDEGHKGGNAKNTHPTVKPTKLMRYLVRLVTPKGGIVLDPFSGSGSTLLAALLEGARFVGIEREEEYALIAEERIQHHARVELGRRSEEAGFDLLAELEQEF